MRTAGILGRFRLGPVGLKPVRNVAVTLFTGSMPMNLQVLLGLVKQGVPVLASAAGEHVAPGVPEETAEEVWGQETDLAIVNKEKT